MDSSSEQWESLKDSSNGLVFYSTYMLYSKYICGDAEEPGLREMIAADA